MSLSNRCPTCGQKQRTKEEHDTLFGAIAEAWENWPEKLAFQPKDPEDLRAWLLCQVGWCLSTEIKVGAAEPVEIARQLRPVFAALADRRTFIATEDGIVRVTWARSLKRRECPRAVFRGISDNIDTLLREITGIGIDEYVRNRKTKAA